MVDDPEAQPSAQGDIRDEDLEEQSAQPPPASEADGKGALLNQFWGVATLLGRFYIAYIFVRAGYSHIADFAGTQGFIAAKLTFIPEGLTPFATVAAILLLVAGSLLVLLGYQCRWGALLLILFLIPTLLFFHNYWAYPEEARGLQEMFFQKNLAILGGLLFVMAHGAGSISLDALLARWRR
ncbi:DoxX family protein [bacterium]|nr:DoxX family protein [bacterium]